MWPTVSRTETPVTTLLSGNIVLWGVINMGYFLLFVEWRICLVVILGTPSDHNTPDCLQLFLSHRRGFPCAAALILPPQVHQSPDLNISTTIGITSNNSLQAFIVPTVWIPLFLLVICVALPLDWRKGFYNPNISTTVDGLLCIWVGTFMLFYELKQSLDILQPLPVCFAL